MESFPAVRTIEGYVWSPAPSARSPFWPRYMANMPLAAQFGLGDSRARHKKWTEPFWRLGPMAPCSRLTPRVESTARAALRGISGGVWTQVVFPAAAGGETCKYKSAASLRPIALNYSANESPASQLSNGVSRGVARCR